MAIARVSPLVAMAGVLCLGVAGGEGGLQEDGAAGSYLAEIKPVLEARCYSCHGALKQKGDLRLDTAQSIHDAGVIGGGELLARTTSDDPDERMPPEGEPLSPEEIAALQTWLESGAPIPEGELPEDDPARHWAFQPIARPEVRPPAHPIDALLAAKHGEAELVPQPEAERGVLLRRLYLSVLGFPPTAAQLEDPRPFEEVLDELLASPHYGERWGRHWMDVWRYAEGYGLNDQLRYSQRHLWHWRDWIVDSLNADKGYDQMLREMLAGDEIAPDDPGSVAGTGFLARNYYLFNRTTWLDSTIEHTGKAFLGLTLNCAKCHDHKYDPISHEDYYRFRALFEPHQIRLDAVAGVTDFSQDGLPRAYDDHLDAPTFLHLRGDPMQPDEDIAITPGVPAFLHAIAPAPDPEPVALPVSASAPGSRDYVQADRIAAAEERLESARNELAKAEQAQPDEADEQDAPAPPAAQDKGTEIADNFEEEDRDRWEFGGGDWRYQGGALVETEITRESCFIRSPEPHLADFDLTAAFRITGGDVYFSAGVRFDVAAGGDDAHTVYASCHAPQPKVQIAHRSGGKTSYPPAGRVPLPIVVDQDYTLRVAVRGELINVFLDGEFLIAYALPPRRPGGRLEFFAFDSTVELESIELRALAPDLELREPANPAGPGHGDGDLIELAGAKLAEARAALAALRARIAADNATFRQVGEGDPAEAARLEREHAVAAARVTLLTAEEGKAKGARVALTKAESALEDGGDTAAYTPLRGSFKSPETPEHKEPDYPATYPETSTGRRRALAGWITSSENPLTARVAANHIWMRHFGEPLVETVFDFGRSAPQPEHAELLDFLASELIGSGWSMKHLHRLLLSSAAWRRSSSNLDADPATLAADPTNRLYWRMNPRRMESQAVRDSLLHLAGQLDLTMGGPPVDPGPGARRRALYFTHSRDGQSPFLAAFDDADILACYRRSESVVPQQALALRNSKVSLEMAAELAADLDGGGGGKDARRFAGDAFFLILCRRPSEDELAACLGFLGEGDNRRLLVHALLNHNDFLTIR